MNIVDATLKLKDFLYDPKNFQIVKIGNDFELTGSSFIPLLAYFGKVETVEDYIRETTIIKYTNFIHDVNKTVVQRSLNNPYEFLSRGLSELSLDAVNTKEYWNFLHKYFPFCDVCSYYSCNDIFTYYQIKGSLYDQLINTFGINFFKNKKILEIGPGYDYFTTILNLNGINHEYYCADIVKRMDYPNFIELDGYKLNINDKFDIVLMEDVIQHLDINIFKTYTTEIKEMLNDNGSLIIGTEVRSKENYFGKFFCQMLESIGITELYKHMLSLGYNIENPKPMFINKFPVGNVLEFKNIN